MGLLFFVLFLFFHYYKRVKKFLFLLLFLIIIFPSSHIKAEPVEKSIVINEIMWMGSFRSTADEWIELKNLSNKEIDLSGWQIEGAGASGNTPKNTLKILSGSIPPNDYFLISNYSKDENTILDVEPDLVKNVGNDIFLSNDNLKLTLKDTDGNIIDEAGNGGEPLTGDNSLKRSMERYENPGNGTKSYDWYEATDSKNLKTGSTELATPGTKNSPEPTVSKIKDTKSQTGEIKISGLVTAMPNIFFSDRLYIQDETAGTRLKLKNGTWPSNIEIGTRLTIKGKIKTYYLEKELQITDISEIEISSKETVIPFSIKTGEISQWEGALVKISGTITETSGDTFYIDDGTGSAKIYIKDKTGITLPQKHKGDKAEITGIVNNWSGNFRILPRITEDIKITPKSTEEDYKVLPISEAKQQPKGTKVKVSGVVSVTPGVLSQSYFYIQDETAGIQIYSYYKKFPNLLLGFFISVSGEISESYGEKRLKISGIEDIIILEARPPPVPQKIKIKDIGNFEGMLVKVYGKVTKASGSTFYISDGSGEIKIVIKKLTGIKKPRLHKGDIVEIIGIVSKTKTGYRILPRYQNDFKLVYSAPKKKKESKIKGASIAKAESLNEPKVVYEVKQERTGGILNLLGWFLIIGSLGSIVYLKRMKIKEKF